MARQHAIVGRLPGPSWRTASTRDFATLRGREVSLARLLADAPDTLSPYALDVPARRVAFVQTSPGLDLAAAHPFVYEAQRRHARQLVVASEEEVVDAARVLRLPEHRPTFLYSTGRCGSTLLGKMVARLDGVQSISEPDVYTQATFARDRSDADLERRLQALLGAVTRLWASHLLAHHPDRPRLLIKHRGFTLFLADLLAAAAPGSRALFLYRDPEAVVRSYDGAFFDSKAWSWVRARGLDHRLLRLVRRSGALPFERFLLPLDDPRCADPEAQGVEGALALLWLSLVQEAARQETAHPGLYGAPLRYEDLLADPLVFARDLAMRLEVVRDADALDPATVAAMMETLATDSQEGSTLARKSPHEPRPEGARAVGDLLARFDAVELGRCAP